MKNIRRIRNTFLTGLIACILIMSGTAFFNITADAAESKVKVRVAFFPYEGFNSVEESGKLSGFGYEYLRELAKYNNWEYEYVTEVDVPDSNGNPTGEKKPMSFQEGLELVREGKLDLIGGVATDSGLENQFAFPDMAAGIQYGVFSISKTNERISMDDLSSLEGARIGEIRGNTCNGEVDTYFENNGISDYKVIEYDSTSELNWALKSKKVDCVYTGSLRMPSDESILLRWNPHPFSFVTTKGNTEVLIQLNQAQQKMIVTSPDFIQSLNNKYYETSTANQINLSSTQKDYVKANKSVTVAVDGSWIPIEYYDEKTKQYKGVISKIFRHITEETGLKFRYKIYDSYEEAVEAVTSGKCQMLSRIESNSGEDGEALELTSGYMRIENQAITRADVTDIYRDGYVYALIKGDSVNKQIEAKLAGHEFRYYTSSEKCVQAVQKGDADVAIIAAYVGDYLLRKPSYNGVRSVALNDFGWEMSFGIASGEKPELCQIMNKGIQSISKDGLNNTITESVLQADENASVTDFFYSHPFASMAFISFLFLLIFAAFLLIMRSRKRELDRKTEDDERLELAIDKANVYLWDIDLAKAEMIQTKSSMKRHGGEKIIKNIPESLIKNDLIHPDDVETYRTIYEKLYKGEDHLESVCRVKGKNTGWRWEKSTYTLVYNAQGKPYKAIVVNEDVTDRKALKDKAEHDRLTGIYNRESLEQMVMYILEGVDKEDNFCAFLMVDLDNFKMLNDTCGHGDGDFMLQAVAAELTSMFRTNDIIARLGGDEFVVFMTQLQSYEHALKKAGDVCKGIRKLGDRLYPDIHLSASIGISLAPQDGHNFKELYEKADDALYRVKRTKKGTYFLYSK